MKRIKNKKKLQIKKYKTVYMHRKKKKKNGLNFDSPLFLCSCNQKYPSSFTK